MKNIITIAQLIVSVLMIAAILMQQRGTALGGAFGGAGDVYRTRRGVEKLLFRFTLLLAVVFVVLSVVSLTINI